MRLVCTALVGSVIASLAGKASAQELAILSPEMPAHESKFMMEFGRVESPPAFKRFCREMPQECIPRLSSQSFAESVKGLEALDEVNRRVNHTVAPETDIEHYGVDDYWTLPKDGRGDCEDYALQKRHNLISMGWPTSSLLMTVVRTKSGEGHAVLTARTVSGDFVLDNRSDDLKLWYQTPYKFKLRQSPTNPQEWLDLDPLDDMMPTPIADLFFGFGHLR